MKRPLRFWAVLLLAVSPATAAIGGPPASVAAPRVSREGARLAGTLDAMGVDRLWLAGAHVNWRTGVPDGRPVSGKGVHSHCSAFAAAACERLGVYLLRPPAASQVLLANAQYDWLSGEGSARGWTRVASASAAQRLANRGDVVVACYKNRDPKKPGHIAVVLPGTKGRAALHAEGPDVTQAGTFNYVRTSAREGFKRHPHAWANREILYFAHTTTYRD
jgi:hypothetical protein